MSNSHIRTLGKAYSVCQRLIELANDPKVIGITELVDDAQQFIHELDIYTKDDIDQLVKLEINHD